MEGAAAACARRATYACRGAAQMDSWRGGGGTARSRDAEDGGTAVARWGNGRKVKVGRRTFGFRADLRQRDGRGDATGVARWLRHAGLRLTRWLRLWRRAAARAARAARAADNGTCTGSRRLLRRRLLRRHGIRIGCQSRARSRSRSRACARRNRARPAVHYRGCSCSRARGCCLCRLRGCSGCDRRVLLARHSGGEGALRRRPRCVCAHAGSRCAGQRVPAARGLPKCALAANPATRVGCTAHR